MERRFEYQFEWDPAKAIRNAREHGISFERAATVFLDPQAMSMFDDEHSAADEERWITLGLDQRGALLVVSHTFRDVTESNAKIRLVSARKANRGEAAQYQGH